MSKNTRLVGLLLVATVGMTVLAGVLIRIGEVFAREEAPPGLYLGFGSAFVVIGLYILAAAWEVK